jgi:DNA-binding FadR family transcriptional regulator
MGSVADNLRRAQALAAQIEAEIDAAGWPVGRVLGSESELLERYQVSRGVLRQAARLLEHYSVARMRPGRNGGLVVTEPDVATIARGAALMLRRKLVEPRHLVAARRSVEMTCVRVAAENIDEAGIERLRECLAAEVDVPVEQVRSAAGEFHLLLAELTGNPVLMLFAEMMVQVTQQRLQVPERLAARAPGIHRAHVAIAEAVIAGDAALAQHRMNVHFNAMAKTWSSAGRFDGASVSPFVLSDHPAVLEFSPVDAEDEPVGRGRTRSNGANVGASTVARRRVKEK